MDAKNAASYVGLSPKTLAMMRCEGTGPKFTKRGRIFYYLEDLDEWLKAGRVGSTAQAAAMRPNGLNNAHPPTAARAADTPIV
jgi:hypothetical protein